MYIDKIDSLIDTTLDDFYINIILNNDNLKKIFKEMNFVKFQKEINEIINNFVNSINYTEIKTLVKSNDAVYSISETIKRYITIYLFLTIGYHYTGKNDTYINNIIEFTKNQSEFGFKISNFFNSESNALIIKYNMMIKNILTLLVADQSKRDILKVKPDYKDTIVFLNKLGNDYIKKNFTSQENQSHYIIKTIIIFLLYKTIEKKEFFRLLELTENLDGEYMFIDIVEQKQNYVDFTLIEQLIGSTSNIKNLAYHLWDFNVECEDSLQKPPISNDEKILLLIESKIIVPICDDFLLYHKDSERYDKVFDQNKIKKKDDTKIRYIVNKIDSTSDYYSDLTKKDEKLKNLIKKNFYGPLINRKAITVNHFEDINIINKFINQGKKSAENSDYFNDLVIYKIYPYINFKDFEKNGFNIIFSKTTDIVRSVSLVTDGEFKQKSNNILQLRVGVKDMSANIVGFMIPTNLKPLQCLKCNDIINIKSLDEKNKNGFDLVVKYLKKTQLGLKNHNSSVYWMFDIDNDVVVDNDMEYEQTNKYSSSEQIKNLIAKLYDIVIDEFSNIIINKLNENIYLQSGFKFIEMSEKELINIPIKSDAMVRLKNYIYTSLKQVTIEYDKKEDIAYGISSTDIILLPEYIKSTDSNSEIIKIDVSGLNEYGVEIDKEYVSGICQHNISWDKISSLQKSDPKNYTKELYNFIQQYLIENIDQEYICKSCGYLLNIKKYVSSGEYDSKTQKFAIYNMPIDITLEDIPEYDKYRASIRNIDKLIEKIASISNIPHLTRSSSDMKWLRKGVVKDFIDILILNNDNLRPIGLKTHKENAFKKYGIVGNLSSLFIFELDNSIFVFSSKEKDHYRIIKQNNVMAYIIYLVILELNDSHIPFIGTDKKGFCNFLTFDKIFYSLFGGIKIKINNNDVADITNYKILCYLIYILGCYAIKYNMWIYDQESTKNKLESVIYAQKVLVNTVVDVINSILDFSSQPGANYLYEIISIKTYKKLENSFKNEDL
jgi:hypothetical protein